MLINKTKVLFIATSIAVLAAPFRVINSAEPDKRFVELAEDFFSRFEYSVEFEDSVKPYYEITTVQPLYQSKESIDNLFTQINQSRYSYIGKNRNVTNLGIGYRRLLNDGNIIVGINSFFDYEWFREHKRVSGGVELKWSGFDLTANQYFGLGAPSSHSLDGTTETVLDGKDFELGIQIPYIPRAKIFVKKELWDSIDNAEDLSAWSASGEIKITDMFKIEGGVRDDNFSEKDGFLKISMKIPLNSPRKTLIPNSFIADSAWKFSDMKDRVLEKVRRKNKIILESKSSGVVITRGN
jgi:hypothetical protein